VRWALPDSEPGRFRVKIMATYSREKERIEYKERIHVAPYKFYRNL
jgi:hypothetical protein